VECARLGDDAVVRADPVALEQIVHNLVGNALQALDEVPRGERRLVLRVERGDGRGVLAVRDSGHGIAPEAMTRLFEPFYTTRADGLGLGLALCATLAAGMDGRVTVRPAPPRGAEFRVELPLMEGTPA
jgi:C4-dicarboxylate-specific signal transduction histidine kinase